MVDIVKAAAEAQAETQAAEVSAVTAQAAAESTVIAAETAVALAASTAAVAEMQAAEEVREVTETIQTIEEQLSWLREELSNHRTADSSWKMTMETRLSEITAAIQLLTASQSLSPPVSEVVEETTTITAQSPESVNADVPPVPETQESQRKKRFGRL